VLYCTEMLAERKGSCCLGQVCISLGAMQKTAAATESGCLEHMFQSKWFVSIVPKCKSLLSEKNIVSMIIRAVFFLSGNRFLC